MMKTALIVSFLAAALAGCSSAAVAPSRASLKAYETGPGTIVAISESSASAGGTAPDEGDVARMAIRMDDGPMQWVDVDTGGANLPPVGARVVVTSEHQIVEQ